MCRPLRFTIVAVFTALLVLTLPSHAQQPGDAGIFADAAGTETTLVVVPNEIFTIHIVGFDLPGGALAFEVSAQGLVPLRIFTLSTRLYGPSPLNLYQGPPFEYLFGTGGCAETFGAIPIVSIELLTPEPVPADTAISLSGTSLSSSDGRPGYADCEENVIVLDLATDGSVGGYPDGALILNPTREAPVRGAPTSFGSLKARLGP